jgi:hypothetical protein
MEKWLAEIFPRMVLINHAPRSPFQLSLAHEPLNPHMDDDQCSSTNENRTEHGQPVESLACDSPFTSSRLDPCWDQDKAVDLEY